MRHRSSTRKLGRTASHRKAMLRTLVTQLLDKEKIITTLPKAKELRSVAEKMITLGKRETLHARRQALAYIRDKGVVFKLFDSVAPRFASRNGGYTRIIKLGSRTGDGAELALIELTGSESAAPKAPAKEEKATREKKAATEKTAGGEARKTKKVASSKKKAAPAEKPARKGTRKKAEKD